MDSMCHRATRDESLVDSMCHRAARGESLVDLMCHRVAVADFSGLSFPMKLL